MTDGVDNKGVYLYSQPTSGTNNYGETKKTNEDEVIDFSSNKNSYEVKNYSEEYSDLLEEMEYELEMQKNELEKSKSSYGAWDKTKNFFAKTFSSDETEKYEEKVKLLNKAIESGNLYDIVSAYQVVYPDEIVEETGKKVSQSSLTEISRHLLKEKESSGDARQIINNINDGQYAVNGKTVTLDDINEALENQAKLLRSDYEDAVNKQGVISKGLGGINNYLGELQKMMPRHKLNCMKK